LFAGTVGNHAGVPGVIFLDLKDDLHQVRTDVGNLGKMPPAIRSVPLPDFRRWRNRLKQDGILTGMNRRIEEHDQQLDADQKACRCSCRL